MISYERHTSRAGTTILVFFMGLIPMLFAIATPMICSILQLAQIPAQICIASTGLLGATSLHKTC